MPNYVILSAIRLKERLMPNRKRGKSTSVRTPAMLDYEWTALICHVLCHIWNGSLTGERYPASMAQTLSAKAGGLGSGG